MDGSFFDAHSDAGFGVVARNHEGMLIDGTFATVRTFSAFATEALALLRVCLLASSLQVFEAVFETDCKYLFSIVSDEGSKFDWRCDAIIFDIGTLLKGNPLHSLRLILIPR